MQWCRHQERKEITEATPTAPPGLIPLGPGCSSLSTSLVLPSSEVAAVATGLCSNPGGVLGVIIDCRLGSCNAGFLPPFFFQGFYLGWVFFIGIYRCVFNRFFSILFIYYFSFIVGFCYIFQNFYYLFVPCSYRLRVTITTDEEYINQIMDQ